MITRLGFDHSFDDLDGPTVVAAAAALQLLPSNASKLLRLQRLSALGLSMPRRAMSSPLSPSKVRALLKSSAVIDSRVLNQEEINEEVLVQSVNFYGGAYLVSPGLGEYSVTIADDLLRCAFGAQDVPAEFKADILPLMRSILLISHLVLRRAGLSRSVVGSREQSGSAFVPGASRLFELMDAVTLTLDDLRRFNIEPETLSKIAMTPAELTDPCAEDWLDHRISMRPLLQVDDLYVVALPMDLLTTLRHALITAAIGNGCVEALTAAYQEVTGTKAIHALQLLGAEYGSEAETTSSMSRHVLKLDKTKLIHLMIAADQLSSYDESRPWGNWDTHGLLDDFHDRIRDFMADNADDTDGVLHLLIYTSPGRDAFFGLEDIGRSDPALMLRIDDLLTIADDADDALDIWYFARALSRLHDKTQVFSFGALDEYAIYKSNDRSFYLGDDEVPTFLHVTAGAGAELRAKVHVEIDRHGVILPGTTSVVDVRRWYQNVSVPMYRSTYAASEPFAVVEGSKKPVFIKAELVDHAPFLRLSVGLLEAVAYWIWQIEQAAPGIISEAESSHRRTQIVICVDNEEAWAQGTPPENTELPPISVTRAGDEIRLKLNDNFRVLMSRDNEAEKELVRQLLSATLVRSRTTASVEDLVTQILPSRSKRMLHATTSIHDPMSWSSDIRRPRHVHDQVTAELLDNLGEWLRGDGLRLPIGEITDERRKEVLNACVSHYFRALVSRVAALSMTGLLSSLVQFDEALQQEATASSRRRPYYIACFGPNSVTVEDLDKQLKDSTQAQIANRFLIEYVTANPPTGSKPLTDSEYDVLLALASEILGKGMLSDALNYGLAETQISMLRSGRLGISRDDPYYAGLAVISSDRAQQTLDSAIRVVADDEIDGGRTLSEVDTDLEKAALDEFGFTFQDLADILGALSDEALDHPHNVVAVKREALLQKVRDKTSLEDDKIAAAFNRLTLAPTDAFRPPGPAVYPWRYNRDRSYVRRPLLLQEANGDAWYVFGLRRVYGALGYWHDSITSARYQLYAKKPSMKRYLGIARNRKTERFTDTVARCLTPSAPLNKVRVKKIGRVPIERSKGQTLGDVDILALDPRSRTIYVLEAKDYEVARTPAELSNELKQTQVGSKSTTALHSARIDWVRSNKKIVLEHFGWSVKEVSKWDVVGYIVTSERLLGPLVRQSPLGFLTIDQLLEEVERRVKRRGAGSRRRAKTRE